MSQDTNAIVTELQREADRKPTIVFCMKIDDTYELAQAWVVGKPALRRVAPPAGLDIDPVLIGCLERGAAFHNAELSEDERLFVEERISAGEVDVVYATSTLAAGVNFPFGAAVFSSWKRWNVEKKVHEPIGRAEFQNMAGRVGRMGQAAAEGLVVMCAEGGTSTNAAVALMNLHAQDELGHGIKPDDFGALALQLFAGKLCHSRADAFELLASTLSASREAAINATGVKHWEPRPQSANRPTYRNGLADRKRRNRVDHLVRPCCRQVGTKARDSDLHDRGVAEARRGLGVSDQRRPKSSG